MKLSKFAWSHHGDYFKLVTDTYSRIEKLEYERNHFQSSLEGKEMSNDDVDFIASRNDAIGELALIVIVFLPLH